MDAIKERERKKEGHFKKKREIRYKIALRECGERDILRKERNIKKY